MMMMMIIDYFELQAGHRVASTVLKGLVFIFVEWIHTPLSPFFLQGFCSLIILTICSSTLNHSLQCPILMEVMCHYRRHNSYICYIFNIYHFNVGVGQAQIDTNA